MKKALILLILAISSFVSLHATHFPAYKAASIKCITHDSSNIYILNQQGIEIFNKSTGKRTFYNKETGYFSEQWDAYELSRPDVGVGLNYLTLRSDTIWVGSSHKDQVSEDRVESRAKLLKYDGNEFTSYDIGPGVEVPISMKCDSQGRIWYLPTAPIDYAKISEYSKGPLCCFCNGEVTRYEWSLDTGYCYCVDIDGDSIYI